MRIGTWNLGRSGAFHRSRISRQTQALQQRHADLWVLTEAHDANVPPGGHVCSSAPHGDFHQRGEHRVVLWSRHPLSPVPTGDALSTVAARLDVPTMDRPLLVYGTVISPAHGGPVLRPALSWQRHLEVVLRQRAEWLRLRQEFPDHALCVAGDFNANLDASASYGTVDPRHGLLQGLADAGLQCLTTDERRAPLALGAGRAGMAHVCFSAVEGLQSSLEAVPASADGSRLSDHDGILVEMSWPQTPVAPGADQAASSGGR